MGKTTPILRILDEQLAKRFYVDYLGFAIDWEHRFEEGFPLYMQVSRDHCVLHLSEHQGDCSTGAALRIETDDIEGYHLELSKRVYASLHPTLEATPWDSKDMSIKDPFGNRLCFTNAIST
jgi:catechol 2,3-dioxygenase-like lactoylglutathione lyase family enzyme